ncbi:MAG: hypothetical protein KatS3mg081_2793 [Gemmatimonadales bacterium]|nr:hypothetical protein HRbin33_01794 [bacterium HR33]GIW53438.1 MAG: hypothetical protein KatS3mg081_2793 [Gemmatimonadales bacterium]
MKRLWWIAAIAGWLSSVSCDGPEVGELTVDLVTPNSDDGAAVLSVSSASSKELLGIAAACDGCRIFFEQVSQSEIRAIVTGPLAPGPLVRVTVSDVGSRSAYSAQLEQVASRSFQLRPLSGYALSVR